MKNPLSQVLGTTVFLFAVIALTSCEKAGPSVENTAKAANVTQPICVEKAGQNVCSQQTSINDVKHVVVFYFHGDRRCRTCRGIQSTIEQTIGDRFAPETASGKLEYREVNFEEDANKHFVQQFQLSFGTMVLATVEGDKILEWENCGKVWDYGHEPPVLMDYVAERIKEHLGKLKVK